MADLRTQHPEYQAMEPTWRKLRAVYNGREAVQAGGTKYLPQPAKMSAERYLDYIARPKWFGATRRTIQAFEGLAFRQPLSLDAPPTVKEHTDLMTSTGVSLTGLARLVFREALLMGRYGVLVDMDANGERPWWAGYPCQSIINWSTAIVRGERRVVRVVLEENEWQPTTDSFGVEDPEYVRVLELVDGIYTQTLYAMDKGVVRGVIEEILPKRQGQPLDFIPFVFFGVDDLETTVALSAVNDLADTNLAYWRHSADYEWSLHLTASPTPWVTGHDASVDIKADGTPEDALVLGSDTAIFLKESDARIGMLEFQGHGLEPLRTAMLDDKEEMASLGARLIEGQPETQETLGAFRSRQMGDTSVIMALAQTLSTGLTRLLRYHAYWFGAATTPMDSKVRCGLPTNFSTARAEPQTLAALMAALQAGHISFETWYWNLQQGEVAEPGVDVDEELARIEANAPAMVRLQSTEGDRNGMRNGARNGVAA